MRRRWVGAGVATTALIILAVANRSQTHPVEAGQLPRYTATVLQTIPVEPVFTQGLDVADDGRLLISHGQYGQSGIRFLGKPSKQLPADQFGEGATFTDDGVLQLTWREHVAYLRDPVTLEVVDTVPFDGEGWGACFDRDHAEVWTSDGSSVLTARDPKTLAGRRHLVVRIGDKPISKLKRWTVVRGEHKKTA